MEEKKVNLPDINCKHCALAIDRELSDIPGVEKIDVDVAQKLLLVSWKPPASWEKIKKKLSEIGYPPND